MVLNPPSALASGFFLFPAFLVPYRVMMVELGKRLLRGRQARRHRSREMHVLYGGREKSHNGVPRASGLGEKGSPAKDDIGELNACLLYDFPDSPEIGGRMQSSRTTGQDWQEAPLRSLMSIRLRLFSVLLGRRRGKGVREGRGEASAGKCRLPNISRL